MNTEQPRHGNALDVVPSFGFKKKMRMAIITLLSAGILTLVMIMGNRFKQDTISLNTGIANVKGDTITSVSGSHSSILDTLVYNEKLMHMVNGDTSGRWPVKSSYPNAGAILPFKRIIAYYGNLYSTRMGILGEFAPKPMLEKLKAEIKNWEMADTTMEVIPALHYIAVTAQGSPGAGGKYRLRMPFKQIDSVLSIARQINAIVFLDLQVGLSTLQDEIPQLETYLKMPNVHLGIDPEFSMKTGRPPGKVVGTFDASDINYASDYLAKLVKESNLPPKILVVHRFTQKMVTNYQQIKIRPEVQLVMHMDGWGFGAKKVNTYRQFIYREPVQFTGFKIFYKNDTKPGSRLMTAKEVLQLKPQPVYIQYQ